MAISKKTVIGITDCGKFDNYRDWLAGEGIDIIKLSYRSGNEKELSLCNGILFSGGEDVDPKLYGRSDFLQYSPEEELDPERDAFEETLFKAVYFKTDLPILGICRGMQFCNVMLGGDLVPDLPVFKNSQAHGKCEGKDRLHAVDLTAGSFLQEIAGAETGIVNSAHHQSVDRVADGFRAVAVSAEGIVEAMEPIERADRFLLFVQWHPERIAASLPFSVNLKLAFLASCRSNAGAS